MSYAERLSEATALLERLENCWAENEEAEDILRDVAAFLSRAPAPAAETLFLDSVSGSEFRRAQNGWEDAEAKLAAVRAVVDAGQCACCVHIRDLLRAPATGAKEGE